MDNSPAPHGIRGAGENPEKTMARTPYSLPTPAPEIAPEKPAAPAKKPAVSPKKPKK